MSMFVGRVVTVSNSYTKWKVISISFVTTTSGVTYIRKCQIKLHYSFRSRDRGLFLSKIFWNFFLNCDGLIRARLTAVSGQISEMCGHLFNFHASLRMIHASFVGGYGRRQYLTTRPEFAQPKRAVNPHQKWFCELLLLRMVCSMHAQASERTVKGYESRRKRRLIRVFISHTLDAILPFYFMFFFA